MGRGISTQLIGGRVYSLQDGRLNPPHGPYSSPEGSVAGFTRCRDCRRPIETKSLAWASFGSVGKWKNPSHAGFPLYESCGSSGSRFLCVWKALGCAWKARGGSIRRILRVWKALGGSICRILRVWEGQILTKISAVSSAGGSPKEPLTRGISTLGELWEV